MKIRINDASSIRSVFRDKTRFRVASKVCASLLVVSLFFSSTQVAEAFSLVDFAQDPGAAVNVIKNRIAPTYTESKPVTQTREEYYRNREIRSEINLPSIQYGEIAKSAVTAPVEAFTNSFNTVTDAIGTVVFESTVALEEVGTGIAVQGANVRESFVKAISGASQAFSSVRDFFATRVQSKNPVTVAQQQVVAPTMSSSLRPSVLPQYDPSVYTAAVHTKPVVEAPVRVKTNSAVVAQAVTEPQVTTVTKIVEVPVSNPDAVTIERLEAAIAELSATLNNRMNAMRASVRVVEPSSTRVERQIQTVYRAIAASNDIDALADVSIETPTITGGTITGTTLANVILGELSGITATEATFGSFDATSTAATSTIAGNLDIAQLLEAEYIVTSSTTATSTFAYGINVLNGCVAVDGVCLGSGGGSGTVNTGTEGQIAYFAADGTEVSGTSTISIVDEKVGIGNSAPDEALNVQGVVAAQSFTATSTTATSTLLNTYVSRLLAGSYVEAPYFVATSTTASTTVNLLDVATAFELGSDYITDITGSGLTITDGALTVTGLSNSDYAHMLTSYDASGNLVATSTPQVASIVATSSTATSTFAGAVGIGTTTVDYRLVVDGSIGLPKTTSADTGVIYKGGEIFIHDFSHPTGGGALPTGYNLFVGPQAGNLTLGSTATQTYNSSFNVGVGFQSLTNVALGSGNVAMGPYAMRGMTNGGYNTSLGYASLYSATTANNNVAFGTNSLYGLLNGAGNVALGREAGRYIADGATANTTGSNSVFLGYATKANADGESNQIVIGYDAHGLGSNTAVIGSSTIVTTVLRGNVGIGTTSPTTLLTVGSTTPNSISADNYYNSAFVAGDLEVDGTLYTGGLSLGATFADMLTAFDSSGNLVATSTPQVASIVATSTTATSTFAGDISVGQTLQFDQSGFNAYITGPGSNDRLVLQTGNRTTTGNGILFQVDTDTSASVSYQSILEIDDDGITFSDSNDPQYITGPDFRSLVIRSQSFNNANDELGFDIDTDIGTAGVQYERILTLDGDNGGRVGIGTQAPAGLLDVAGDVVAQYYTATSTTATSTLLNTYVNQLLAGSFVEAPYFTATSTTATSSFAGGFVIGTSNFVVDPDAGRVGIGTANPAAQLHITNNFLLENNTEIRQKDSGGTERTIIELDSADNLNIGGSYAGALKFIGGGSYTEVMRIHDNGNIGIGTTSPYAKLSVVGETVAEYFTATSSNATSTFAGEVQINNYLTVPGSGADSLQLGYAQAGGNNAVAIGARARANTTGSTDGIAIGVDAYAKDARTVAIGKYAYANQSDSIYIGGGVGYVGARTGDVFIGGMLSNTSSSGQYRVGVGYGIDFNSLNETITLGANAAATADNQLMIGANNATGEILEAYIGQNTTGVPLIYASTTGIGLGTTTATVRLAVGSTTPNSISADNYYNSAFVAGDLEVDGTLYTGGLSFGSAFADMLSSFDSSGNLVATSTPQVASIVATSTTATSTFAGGATFATGGGNVGIGTSTPQALFTIHAGNTNRNILIDDDSIGFTRSFEGATGAAITYGDADMTVITDGSLRLGSNNRYGLTVDYDNTSTLANVHIGDDANLTSGAARLTVEGGVAIGSGYVTSTNWATNGLVVEGSLGLGTTSPTTLLTVGSTTPNSISADDYYNSAFVAGDLEVDGTLYTGGLSFGSAFADMLSSFDSSGNLVATSTPQVASIVATSTTATSTFAGALGVGTTTPTEMLSVAGKLYVGNNNGAATSTIEGNLHVLDTLQVGTGSSYLTTGSLYTGYGQFTDTAGTTTFAGGLTVDSTDLVVDPDSGRVGIGTATPGNALEVAGSAQVLAYLNSSNTASYLRFGNSSATAGYIGYNAGNLEFQTAAATRMTIDSSGNVGIGTTTPGALLSVASNTADEALLEISRYDVSKGLRLTNYNGTDTSFRLEATTNFTTWNDLMAFDVNNLFVGVGTSSPNSEFHVSNSGEVIGIIGSTNAGGSLLVLDGDSDGDGSGGDYAYLRHSTSGDLNLVNLKAGAIDFATNGSSADMTLSSAGYLGIGTTSPTEGLTIGGSDIYKLSLKDSTTYAALGTSNGSLLFYNAGDERMRIDSSGNVGIGTASPGAKLDIQGSAATNAYLRVAGGSGSTIGGIYLGNVSSNYGALWFDNSNNNVYLQQQYISGSLHLGTNSSTDVTIDSSGNVGIGTTTPGATTQSPTLVVAHDGASPAVFDTTDVNGGYITLSHANSPRTVLGSSAQLLASGSAADTMLRATGQLQFGANSSTIAHITLDTSGNVGIGTTTPGSPLTVQADSSTNGIQIYGRASDDGSDIDFTSNDGATRKARIFVDTLGFNLSGQSSGASNLLIDSSGNVGIGTTTPGAGLHIAKDSTYNSTTDQGLKVGSASSPNNFIRFGYDTAIDAGYIQSLENGVNYRNLLINPNGGNVGIGTTSPGSRLDVHDGNLRLSDSDIAHGFTTLTSNGSVLEISPLSGTAGGALIAGYAEASVAGLVLRGLIGAGDPSDATPAMQFRAGKQSGTTGTTLGALETAFQFSDWDGGTDWMTITANGYVGIGDTSPDYLLDIQGTNGETNIFTANAPSDSNGEAIFNFSNSDTDTATANARMILGTGGANAGDPYYQLNISGVDNWSMGIDNSDSDKFQINNGIGVGSGSEFTIDTSGNVGIGSTTPDSQLVIGGTGNLNIYGSDSRIKLNGTTILDSGFTLTNIQTFRQIAAGNDNYFLGNLGIGTTTPQHELEVAGSGDATIRISSKSTNISDNNRIGSLQYYSSDTDAETTVSEIVSRNPVGDFGNTFDLAFSTYGSGALTEQMRITGGGNVGIGTTTPTIGLGKGLVIDGGNSYANLTLERGTVATGAVIDFRDEDHNLDFRIGTNHTSGGADNLTFAYGSGPTLGMVLTSGGNVGIGTASPSRKFVVYDTDANTPTISIKTDGSGTASGDGFDLQFASNNTFLFNRESGYMSFGTANTERMRIDSSGNVGIGTTTPTTLLTIADADASPTLLLHRNQSIADGNDVAGISFMNLGTVTANISSEAEGSSEDAAHLRFYTATGGTLAERMRIDSSGNVGIGTASPQQKLEVYGGNISIVPSSDSSSATTGELRFYGDNSPATFPNRYASITGINSGGLDQNELAFNIGYGSTISEAMRINDQGNVGIATTTPDNPLTVIDNTVGVSVYASFGPSVIDSSSRNGGIQIMASGSSDSTWGIFNDNNPATLNFEYLGSRENAFQTGTTALTLASGGNVGIGTTSPLTKLHIASSGNDAGLILDSIGSDNYEGIQFKYAGSNTGYIGQETTSSLYMGATNNLHFRTGGAAMVAGTTRMTIDSSGNVGIGTSTPQGILDIQADSNSRVIFEDSGTNRIQLRFDDENNSAIHADFEAYQYNFQDGNGSDVVTINPDGYLGIGTTSPATLLTVAGAYASNAGQLLVAPSGDGDIAAIGITTTRGADRTYNIFAGGTGSDDLNFRIRDHTAGVDRMVIDSSGNVGIGDTNPTYKLSVAGNVEGDSYRVGGSGSTYIGKLGNDGTGILEIEADGTRDIQLGGSTGGTAMFIDTSAGNVGIGSTTPSGKLVVYTGASGGTPNTSADELVVEASGTGGIQLLNGTSASGYILFGDSGGSAQGQIRYLHSDDSLGLYTNASERVHIDSSGNVGIGTTTITNLQSWGRILQVSNYSATNGAALSLADQNNEWNIATYNGGLRFSQYGGSPNLIVTSAGNVGIGTTSPSSLLHLADSGADVKLILDREDASAFSLYTDSGGKLRIRDEDASSDRLTIDSSGLVGINTTSPVEDLHVHSGTASTRFNITNSTTGATVSDGLSIQMEGNEAYIWNYESSNMRFGTSNDTKMVIDSSGNVGIGTTAPDQFSWGNHSLSLVGSGTNQNTNLDVVGTGTGAAALIFGGGTTSGTADNIGRATISGIDGSHLTFNTNASDSGSSFTERMRITSAGNVGIGTTTPDAQLTIHGTPSGTNPLLMLSRASSGQEWGISPDNNYFNIFDYTNNASAPRLTIDTSGNVGIGTASPAQPLEVVGTTPLRLTRTGNASYDFTVSDIGAGDLQLLFDSVTTNTGFGFRPRNSGGTQVEALLIDPDGKVGIGTTTPNATLNVHTADGGAMVPHTNADDLVIENSGAVGLSFLSPNSNENSIFFGDPDLVYSGQIVYAHSSDSMRFTTNNSEAVRIDNSGQVGIGTSSPDTLLYVEGGALYVDEQANLGSRIVRGDNGLATYPSGSDSNSVLTVGLGDNATLSSGAVLRVKNDGNRGTKGNASGSPLLRLDFSDSIHTIFDEDGNVGIGTTSPSALLAVDGGNIATDGVFQNWRSGAQLGIYGTTNGHAVFENGSGMDLLFKPGNSESVRFTSAGNVGIGTASPITVSTVNTSISGSASASLFFEDTGYEASGNGLFSLTYDNGGFKFETASRSGTGRTGNSEVMRITEGGNVGIGTTTPAGMLDIYGASPKLSIDASSGSPELQFTDGGVDEFAIYYDTGSNFLAFNEGGVGNRMVIEDGGNVGIGTTTPNEKFHVVGDAVIGDTFVDSTSSSDVLTLGNTNGSSYLTILNSSNYAVVRTGPDSSGNGSFILKNSSNQSYVQLNAASGGDNYIANGGNVGIGTTTPQALLEINGVSSGIATSRAVDSVRIGGSASGRSTIVLDTSDTTYTNRTWSIENIGNQGSLYFSRPSLNAMVINNSGYVGIGTTSPATLLTVAGAYASNAGQLLVAPSGDGDIAAIGITTTRGADRTYNIFAGGTGSDDLNFRIRDHTAGVDRMVIDSSGNIGVATTTPTAKLSVTGSGTGTGRAFVVADSANDEKFAILDNGTVVGGIGGLTGGYTLSPTGGSNFYGLAVYRSSSGLTSPDIWDAGGTGVVIGHNSSSADLVINSSGSVGIGTSSPLERLHVGDGTTAIQRLAIDGATQSHLAFYQAGAVQWYFSHNDSVRNGLDFYEASTGSAMSIASGGNVGIGTTTPVAKLHVYDGFSGTTASSLAQRFVVESNGGTGMTILGTDAVTQRLYFGVQSDNDFVRFQADYNSGDSDLALYVRGTETATFKQTGVGIASSTPWRTFGVTGTVAFDGLTSSGTGNAVCITTNNDITDAGGGSCTPSSIRFKENVADLNDRFGLDTLEALRPVTFDYKTGYYNLEDGKESIGMIAEEVALVDTRLVDYEDDGVTPRTLQFERFIAVLVDAVQDIMGAVDVADSGTDAVTLKSVYTGTTTPAIYIDENGNIGLGTTTPAHTISAASGAHLTAGGTWVNASSRTLKENYTEIDKDEILEKIQGLTIEKWNYIAEHDDIQHIGPYAEDFYDTFGLGGERGSISSIDPAGVALVGIQVLADRLDALEANGNTSEVETQPIDYVLDALESLGVRIEQGIAYFGKLVADRLVTKEICVGDTCVNETQLASLLANNNIIGGTVDDSSIDFDNVAPTITLLGKNPWALPLGSTYDEPGAEVTDNVDEAVEYTITGAVDTNTIGEQKLTYSATDSHGNLATTSRTVIIYDPDAETTGDTGTTTPETTEDTATTTPEVIEETPAEEPVVEETPTEPVVEETPVEEPVVEETPVIEETPAEEPVVEETPTEPVVEETPVEEPVVEETPVVEEAPIEEPVVEETPAV